MKFLNGWVFLMVVICKKKSSGYKPIRGNELEIIAKLMESKYYDESEVTFKNDDVYFTITNEYGEEENFKNFKDAYFRIEENGEVIFKYNTDPFEYIAVIFDICKIDSVYAHWLLLAPNIKSIRRLQTNPITWELQLHNSYFANNQVLTMSSGDILIFNRKSRKIHTVLERIDNDVEETLRKNDYTIIEKGVETYDNCRK